jgi:hypothetical protein
MIGLRYVKPWPALRPPLLGILASVFLFPGLLKAQSQPGLTWQGEVRSRLYGREPEAGEWDQWISMRTRLGLAARWDQGLGLFVQIQDVRFWGEETTHRDRNADAVDFHQAYMEVDSVPRIGGRFRVGRQEVSVGEGRLIAAPDWGQAGQSFDGARWYRSLGKASLDLGYIRLREGSAETHRHSADLLTGWLVVPVGNTGSLEFLALHQRFGKEGVGGQSSLGSIWKHAAGDLSFRVQGMVQTGEREGLGVSAYLIAARGTLSILEGRGSVTLWYDYLSGDSDPEDGEIGSFSNLFGGRHRYYGRADYFVDVTWDTRDLGLQDAALKLAYSPTSLFSVNLDLHTFRTAQDGDLSSRHLAEEADLWIRYRFRDALDLEVGYSLTWAGSAMEELERLRGTGNVGYFMTSLHF